MINKKDIWDEKSFTFNEHGSTVLRLMAIANEIKKTGYGKSVLDLGCGLALLKKMLGKDFEYFGCDVSPSIVQLHTTENIKEVDLDCNSLPFTDLPFNYIICSGIIEYLADVPKFLRDISQSYGNERCLFLITVVNLTNIDCRFRMIMRRPPNFYPLWINFYSPHAFLNLLRKQGFNVLRYYPLYSLIARPRALSRMLCRIFPSQFGRQFLFICTSKGHRDSRRMAQTRPACALE